QLASRGVGVIDKRIERPTSNGVVRGCGEAHGEGTKPVGCRPTIVVGEGQKLALGVCCTGVPRCCRPSMRLPEEKQVKPTSVCRHHRLQGRLAAVVHDDHFKVLLGVVEVRQCCQTCL